MSNCEICGESMPVGEEMFYYHGLSGPCPKPALPQPKLAALIAYLLVDKENGEYWIRTDVDSKPYAEIGPYDTAEERQRVLDDLLSMMRSQGAQDLPNKKQ